MGPRSVTRPSEQGRVSSSSAERGAAVATTSPSRGLCHGPSQFTSSTAAAGGTAARRGENYCIDRELEDLFAVQEQTHATIVFGHSYGGLIALQAASRAQAFSDVLAYEPGVSVGGSIPLAWMTPYR